MYLHLGSLYVDFQEKILPETSWKNHCSNVTTTMKSLELFPRRFREDFFLKIGIIIRSPKVYTKKRPPTEKYVTSSLPRPELRLSSKSL